jgi:hypothetical protein
MRHGPWRGRMAAAAPAAVAAVLVPSVASAHAITGRVDSPLPFVAYVAGAAVAVGASFLIVAVSDPGPPREPTNPRIRILPRWLRLGLRGLGLFAWLWIVAQALAGGSSDADVSSLFLWVYGWVGLAIVSAVVGPAWTWIDPFTTLYDIGAWVVRRLGIQGWAAQAWPDRLGYWPAVAGFAFVIWLELVARILSGGLLGLVLLGYTIVTLAGMAQYGRDEWRERGETFSVWFALLGRLAPLALDGEPEQGRVRQRPYGSGLITGRWPLALVVMVALGTGSILYDGLSQTSTFVDAFGFPPIPTGTLLLGVFMGVLVALVVLVARRVGMAATGAGLLPVALGYLVAHYLSTLLIDGQRIAIALSDPFNRGWDLLGTAFWERRTDWLPTGIVWSIQVTAVVTGHIVGAWAGHAASATETRRTGRAATRASQLPLAVLMVALTGLTLWSLGQNLVFETETPATASTRSAAWHTPTPWDPPAPSTSRRPGGPVSSSMPG